MRTTLPLVGLLAAACANSPSVLEASPDAGQPLPQDPSAPAPAVDFLNTEAFVGQAFGISTGWAATCHSNEVLGDDYICNIQQYTLAVTCTGAPCHVVVARFADCCLGATVTLDAPGTAVATVTMTNLATGEVHEEHAGLTLRHADALELDCLLVADGSPCPATLAPGTEIDVRPWVISAGARYLPIGGDIQVTDADPASTMRCIFTDPGAEPAYQVDCGWPSGVGISHSTRFTASYLGLTASIDLVVE
jgi:hypothetical protein